MPYDAWYAACMVQTFNINPDEQIVGSQSPRKNLGSHIDASHSRQPLIKGERLVRYEVNAVMLHHCTSSSVADRLKC